MTDYASTLFASIWTALTMFIAGNIEPMPGVWVAAISGSMLSAFTGTDKPFLRLVIHIVSGVLVGVFSSQLLAEVIALKNPLARVAEAFFCAMFAEKIVSAIHNGTILDGIRNAMTTLFGGKK